MRNNKRFANAMAAYDKAGHFVPKLYSEGDAMTVQHKGSTFVAKVDWTMGDDVRVRFRDANDNLTFTWFRNINGPRA
jgi:hypothetical protein